MNQKLRRTRNQQANSLQLIARAIHGLEWAGAAEIEGRLQAKVLEQRHREIRFEMHRLDPALLELGSIDDVFLIAAHLQQIDHTRASLASLAAQAAAVDFGLQTTLLNQIRQIPQKPSFTVVASFLGRRNYNRFEIEESVGGTIASKTRWRRFPKELDGDQRADLVFRVHLSEDGGFLGVRLSATPLHRRAYKIESRTGTLHPPAAFAMALLAGVREDTIVIDPCCGVGTIPIEALMLESRAQAFGSDLEIEMLRKAAVNAREASRPVDFLASDAARLPFEDASIDRVVCNPPWDRAVHAQGLLIEDAGRLLQEIRRVLRPQGRAALLSEKEVFEKIDLSGVGLKLLAAIPISLFGVWPSLYLLSPQQSTEFDPIDPEGSFGNELSKFWRQRRI